ncbi:hypothetical protein TVAG_214860 [Trichomonas vaginalis G3]|uniref:SMP-LTD domain-containing protein n=1 Tax=Trichomonas vaginalis (strain ATCC PRA-98 / G3) TaxID=412133 RepID=A2DK90_TRIV3|nr:hypothetical protein TVAGG3_0170910 [Trichomonas vaginalis G3]EAY19261.1 hypothetical protein TVAG_214860 [Trichomonas vaginalis G3]KAI5548569.1 hypothetical protein TVAGG3_0170910 [Trichomonas vaginalis G3]|eukprot:XP_001580247.1 hypothetical protein [Trichomonas vaginalis G3]
MKHIDIGFSTYLLGFFVGIAILLFAFMLLGMLYMPKRLKGHPKRITPPDEKESADWLNILLARLNASHIDAQILSEVCKLLSQKIASEPKKPDVLTSAVITPYKPADSAPFISDIQLKNESDEESTLSFLLHFQGSPSISIAATVSAGPIDIPQLFSFHMKVELILCLLVARVTIKFKNDKSKEISVCIGNDLIIDINVKPLLDDPKNASQKHIESISTWFSNFAIMSLRGKTFNIPVQ